MKEKLTKLYNECIEELKSIGIYMEDSRKIGKITINMAKRTAKRYGCCKQSKPVITCYHIEYKNHRRRKVYDVFFKHDIEISKWVLDLNDDIIKNTIMLKCFFVMLILFLFHKNQINFFVINIEFRHLQLLLM